MPQREPQIIVPPEKLSSAFKICPGYYDHPGAAEFLLRANVIRLGKLEECQQAVVAVLRGPISSEMLRVNAGLNTTFETLEDAILHGAFEVAVKEILRRNTERVRRALRRDTDEPPTDEERLHATALYGADFEATWPQIAEAREAYNATEWMLGYAASPPDGREPLTIRHALAEIALGRVSVRQTEHTAAFRAWSAAVLEHMPHADKCVG